MKPHRLPQRTTRSHETIQHYAIRAHLALEELKAGDIRTQWLIELGCYVEIAWQCGSLQFRSPPKAIEKAKAFIIELLNLSQQNQLPAGLTDAQWQALCSAVSCADGVWQRIPDDLLFRVMHQISKAIQVPDSDCIAQYN